MGVRPDTIRHYERAGLLPAPERTAAGYRSYDAGALDRLRFIQGAHRAPAPGACPREGGDSPCSS